MTFGEFRQRTGAVVAQGIDAGGFYTLPGITLPQLIDIVGEPTQLRVNSAGIGYISYRVSEGYATVIARVEGPAKRLEGALVFLKQDNGA